MDVLQIILLIGSPLAILWAEEKVPLFKFLGSVIICYIFGAILGNLPFWSLNFDLSKTIVEAAVPLSIPLLLFSTDFIKWLRLAKKTVFSFIIILITVLIVSSVGAFVFKEHIPEVAKIAGMLVGVYTGGTANMSAIGLALKVKEEVFLILNTADMLLGGFYFFLALSFIPRVLAKFLPEFESTGQAHEVCEVTSDYLTIKRFKEYTKMFLLSALIMGASIGLSLLMHNKMVGSLIILSITTLAIAASFVKKIREVESSYDLGQYLLLIFCVAIGSMAKLDQLASDSMIYFAYTGFVMLFATLMHFGLCKVFKIDRDTALITSIAGIFGPAFIGPVAAAIKNREIVVSGLTSGLVGIALGNYLGILLAKFLATII